MSNAPYVNGVTTVTTTATLIASPGAGGIYLTNTGAVPVILGGSLVTATGATSGPSLAAGASIIFPATGEAHDLYGITASGTTTVAFAYAK